MSVARILANAWRLLKDLVVDLAPSQSGSSERGDLGAQQDDVLDAAQDDDATDATGL